MSAPGRLKADVVGTGVAVVTIDQVSWDAAAVQAIIPGGACIVVGAK
jgi:hypothetical protein